MYLLMTYSDSYWNPKTGRTLHTWFIKSTVIWWPKLSAANTSAMSLLTALGALLVLFWVIYQFFLFPKFISSLSSVPPIHWSAKFSSIYSLYVRYKGTELSNLVEAHKKHGPLVQVGPRDVSVNCYQDGVLKIYDAGFGKPTAWYSMFNYFG